MKLSATLTLAALLAAPSSALAAEPIPLRAGPLEMLFDSDLAFLRYVNIGPHEVLRGINAPIRNQVWGTVAPQISNLKVEKGADNFQITFDVLCREDDLDFRWSGSLTGSSEGEVTYTFDGEAHSTFKRNRIGFCVLHGPSAAGQPWTIETVDGEKSKGQFPSFISPHQPAKSLKAIVHKVAEGIHARVEFAGDIFEMEDQRNWTDASFKTYCTPLEIPYPAEVKKGTKISQKVSLRIDTGPDPLPAAPDRVVLTLGEKRSALPLLGLQVSSGGPELTDRQVERLAQLHLDHLRVDLALSEDSYLNDFRRAAAQAKALGISLQIGLELGENPDVTKLAEAWKDLQVPVSFWLVTGGKASDYEMARARIVALDPEAKIGVTRRTNFVDLNRERPTEKTIAAVGFAINPQIHAFDNASIMETPPIHADAVRSARQFAGELPLVIGPMTLRPRPAVGGPPTDSRQSGPLTAAWTLASIKFLAEGSAHSATYFETTGVKGIMDAEKEFAVYQALHEIGEFAGGQVQQIDSTDNLAAVALALRKSGRLRVLVANMSGEAQTVTLRGVGQPAKLQLLNGKEISATPELVLELPPYGIARLDRAVD